MTCLERALSVPKYLVEALGSIVARVTLREQLAHVETKGAGAFYQDPFGRLRDRRVASIPNRFAILRTQSSSPNGRPRWTLTRSASSSDAVCGRFTRTSQSRGRSIGQSLSHVVNVSCC